MIRLKVYLHDAKTLGVEIASMAHEDWVRTMDAVRGFPEKKWSRAATAWKVPVTATNIVYLWQHFERDEVELDSEASIALRYLEATETIAERRAHRRWKYIFEDEVPQYEWHCKRTPYRHQTVAVDAAMNLPYFGWLMEQGTGKTLVAIEEMVRVAKEHKAEGKGALRCLVVCPRTLWSTWMRELEASVPDDVTYWAWRLYWDKSDVVGGLVQGMRASADLKVWVTNYEKIRPSQEAFEKMEFDFIIADEVTMVKNPQAKRSKALLALAQTCSHRRMLTGTIMANSILDVYAPFEFLEPQSLGHASYYSFRHAYGRYVKLGGWEKLVGYYNIDRLKERMARHSFIVKKDQCLDLPPKAYQTVTVDMGKTQGKLYAQMLDWFFATLTDETDPDGTVEAKNVISKMMRLAQITSGFIRNANGDVVRIDDGDAKAEAAYDIITGADGKALVWCRFREDIRYLRGYLEKRGVHCVEIHGGVSDDEREQAMELFNNPGGARVLIGEAGTGGIGLTLLGPPEERCCTMIYYSLDWSLQKREQSEDRAHRIGQDKTLTIYDLVCDGTIDAVITERVLDKKRLADELKDMQSIRDLLLGKKKRDVSGPKIMANLASWRAILKEREVELEMEPDTAPGCEEYDHTDNAGRKTLHCPYCCGDPMTAPDEVVVAYLKKTEADDVNAA